MIMHMIANRVANYVYYSSTTPLNKMSWFSKNTKYLLSDTLISQEEKETVEESKDPSLVLHVQGETRFTTYPEEEDEVDIYTTHSDDEDFDLDDDLDL